VRLSLQRTLRFLALKDHQGLKALRALMEKTALRVKMEKTALLEKMVISGFR
jgi:hypothetical protein